MHPVTFKYKIARRLRKKCEARFPHYFFAYGQGPDVQNGLFESFQEIVPFYPIINLCKNLIQVEQDLLLKKARNICNHNFDLLGSGPYNFGKTIDWHLDFKSGFRWPESLIYSLISSVKKKPWADIKVPWELSRFNHSITLSLAYCITKKSGYVDEFISQIKSWLKNNPTGFGVNWSCTMEVSIRSVNWMAAFFLMFDELMKKKYFAFRTELVKALWHHAWFISTHLEWLGPKSSSGANHFLSNLAGLFTVGLLFQKSSHGRKWYRFAYRQLEIQMMRQVLSDGVHFECSPSYHRLVLEMFMWCGALAQRSGSPFSKNYYERIEKMKRFVADYIKPDGSAPLIGDNDDGRLLATGILPIADHRYLMPEEKARHGLFFTDRFLIDGTKNVCFQLTEKSVFYESGGFYFLRNGTARVLIRAGRIAHAGGHAHNDQLSFELTIYGHDIFVDRGSFVYTSNPEARNHYRSTASHNVMQINGKEQNRFGSTLFGMSDETRTIVLNAKSCLLEAEHTGFRELNRSDFRCQRRFELKSKNLLINDSAKPLQGGDIIKWFFHISPGIRAFERHKKIELHGESFVCIMTIPPESFWTFKFSSHSPSYGVKVPAKTLVITHRVNQNRIKNNFFYNINWELK